MKLLVAVEQCKTRIVGNEVYLHLLISPNHHHIFHDTRSLPTGDFYQFKSVAMQRNRMNVVTRISHS